MRQLADHSIQQSFGLGRVDANLSSQIYTGIVLEIHVFRDVLIRVHTCTETIEESLYFRCRESTDYNVLSIEFAPVGITYRVS